MKTALPALPAFALFAFVLSCSETEELLLLPESFTEQELKSCSTDSCAEVTINYVKAIGDEAVAAKINAKIEHFIIASLLLGEDSVPTAKTIREAAENFTETYREDLQNYPDMTAGYFAEIAVNELFRSEKLLCLETRQYLFSGGAHGYGTVSFLNLDPKTGEEIPFGEIFTDEREFVLFAEQLFRKQQQIPADASINATGFWFENESFYLPEKVGFTQDSLIFVYNQYDIASYAEGPVELRISREKAAPFLKLK